MWFQIWGMASHGSRIATGGSRVKAQARGRPRAAGLDRITVNVGHADEAVRFFDLYNQSNTQAEESIVSLGGDIEGVRRTDEHPLERHIVCDIFASGRECPFFV